jgi:hypothetical protein
MQIIVKNDDGLAKIYCNLDELITQQHIRARAICHGINYTIL